MLSSAAHFVSLGLLMLDDFQYLNPDGSEVKEGHSTQVGGGGLYAAIGARIWYEPATQMPRFLAIEAASCPPRLPPTQVGLVVDKGYDFPSEVQVWLETYGREMWMLRDLPQAPTTRSLTTYQNGQRSFKFLTARPSTTLSTLRDTDMHGSRSLHLICPPKEAIQLTRQIEDVPDWSPVTIYEPVPYACLPEELPSLIEVLPYVDIFSPNSKESLDLLSITETISKEVVELAAETFLKYGIGFGGQGHVIIRCDVLGAYIACRQKGGLWVDAYWTKQDSEKVIEVTGAGNSFLGGLAAGLFYSSDVYEAVLYGVVSASFTIEQSGPPKITRQAENQIGEEWNEDSPRKRLQTLMHRHRANVI